MGPQHDSLCDKRAQPKRQAPLSLKTYMVAEPRSVQFSSRQDPSSEQNVDALDKKLTDSLWAVASNRDREHQETRQATQVKSAELIDKAQNEIAQLMEEEQYPGQNPRNTSSTQWR